MGETYRPIDSEQLQHNGRVFDVFAKNVVEKKDVLPLFDLLKKAFENHSAQVILPDGTAIQGNVTLTRDGNRLNLHIDSSTFVIVPDETVVHLTEQNDGQIISNTLTVSLPTGGEVECRVTYDKNEFDDIEQSFLDRIEQRLRGIFGGNSQE